MRAQNLGAHPNIPKARRCLVSRLDFAPSLIPELLRLEAELQHLRPALSASGIQPPSSRGAPGRTRLGVSKVTLDPDAAEQAERRLTLTDVFLSALPPRYAAVP